MVLLNFEDLLLAFMRLLNNLPITVGTCELLMLRVENGFSGWEGVDVSDLLRGLLMSLFVFLFVFFVGLLIYSLLLGWIPRGFLFLSL